MSREQLIGLDEWLRKLVESKDQPGLVNACDGWLKFLAQLDEPGADSPYHRPSCFAVDPLREFHLRCDRSAHVEGEHAGVHPAASRGLPVNHPNTYLGLYLLVALRSLARYSELCEFLAGDRTLVSEHHVFLLEDDLEAGSEAGLLRDLRLEASNANDEELAKWIDALLAVRAMSPADVPALSAYVAYPPSPERQRSEPEAPDATQVDGEASLPAAHKSTRTPDSPAEPAEQNGDYRRDSAERDPEMATLAKLMQLLSQVPGPASVGSSPARQREEQGVAVKLDEAADTLELRKYLNERDKEIFQLRRENDALQHELSQRTRELQRVEAEKQKLVQDRLNRDVEITEQKRAMDRLQSQEWGLRERVRQLEDLVRQWESGVRQSHD